MLANAPIIIMESASPGAEYPKASGTKAAGGREQTGDDEQNANQKNTFTTLLLQASSLPLVYLPETFPASATAAGHPPPAAVSLPCHYAGTVSWNHHNYKLVKF